MQESAFMFRLCIPYDTSMIREAKAPSGKAPPPHATHVNMKKCTIQISCTSQIVVVRVLNSVTSRKPTFNRITPNAMVYACITQATGLINVWVMSENKQADLLPGIRQFVSSCGRSCIFGPSTGSNGRTHFILEYSILCNCMIMLTSKRTNLK